MNIMPKHEAHTIVASFDSQYWHCGESEEIAAPQFGQLRVSACISIAPPALLQLNIPGSTDEWKTAGRASVCRAILILWVTKSGCKSTKSKPCAE
jgi:hypothetical protein